jgi:DNA repair protein RadC
MQTTLGEQADPVTVPKYRGAIPRVRAVFERGELSSKKPDAKCAREVYEFVKPLYDQEPREVILVLMLDSKNRIQGYTRATEGTLNSSLIHPREIFRTAILTNCNSIIITHNHPSGDPTPSADDRKITKELAAAGEILEIKVLDHIVCGDETYYSFGERNQM